MSWYTIDKPELADGGHVGIEVDGTKLLVTQLAGQLYVTSNLCPHVGAVLSPGDVEDGQIRCPLHNWTFDVKTGDCTFPDNGPKLQTIPTREFEGQLQVEL